MCQAESAADQTAARKDILNLFGRGAGGHVEILGNLAQQQITNTTADNKSFKSSFLQFTYDIGRVWAEVS